MQTTSMISSVTLAALLAFLTIHLANAAYKLDGPVSIKDGATISYAAEKRRIAVEVSAALPLAFEASLKLEIDKAAKSFLVGKEVILDEKRAYVLMVLQKPSRPEARGKGHCGAGMEETLRLLEVDTARRLLVQRDAFQIGSCLNNIAIFDDSGADLEKHLNGRLAGNTLRIEWLSHPELSLGCYELTISNGKILTAKASNLVNAEAECARRRTAR